MSYDADTLYDLLPAIYRIRDAEIAESMVGLLTPAEQARLQELRTVLASGGGLDATQQRDLAALEEKRLRGPLKALLAVIAEEIAGVEENVEQLYDDQFIETGAAWTIPYIGDLVGYRPLDPVLQRSLGSSRAEVANTIRFRRRKGTAAVLEELALGVTGWDAAVVEFFQRIATTQYLNHIRLDHPGTADLRRVDQLEAVGTAFDGLAHTADVRRISTRAGRYNIPNVGVFLWRIGSRPLTDASAFRVDGRRYLFNPLGADTQLYDAAERSTDVTRLAQPGDVPLPITRRALRRRLGELYGPGASLSIQVGSHVLGLGEVEACDLSDTGPDPETSDWAHAAQAKAAIDPVLGRLMLPNATTEAVRVTYHHGALGDIGGGEHDRPPRSDDEASVRSVPGDRPDIAQALADRAGSGTVEVTDSRTYSETPELSAGANAVLTLRGANGTRPLLALTGDLVVGGGDSGEVVVEGLVVAGGRVVVPAQVDGQPNRVQRLRLVDCTLVPGGSLTRTGDPGPAPTSLEVEAENVQVEIVRSIVGGVRVSEESRCSISDSIVDGLAPANVGYAAPGAGPDPGRGGALTLVASTLIGKLHGAELTASDAILHAALGAGDAWVAPVIVERRQAGHVRFSYVPLGSKLPPRYLCQPEADQPVPAVPAFTSTRYGAPGYCQLHAGCPAVIRCGASDGSEMGAFHDLYAPQRAAALGVRLDEYLRFGLEAGLFLAS